MTIPAQPEQHETETRVDRVPGLQHGDLPRRATDRLPAPFYSDSSVTLYCGDADEILPALALEDVPLVLTDPPYNVSSRDSRANTSVGSVRRRDGTMREIVRNFGEWDHDWNPAVFLSEASAMLRVGGSLVAFTSEFLMGEYLNSDLDHRGLLYWRKTNPAPNFRQQVVRAVEMAVWQVQGPSGWTFNAGGYRPNVWEGPIINGFTRENTNEERWHPTQKPEWLMNEWVALFSNPGDLVVDPYAGSGTTLVAAKRLGRRAIGIEINQEYCDRAIRRLRQSALDLFAPDEAPKAKQSSLLSESQP